MTRYSTSSSLSVNRSIPFRNAEQSTALKSHSCLNLYRCVRGIATNHVYGPRVAENCCQVSRFNFPTLGPRARALRAPGCPRYRRARGPRAATKQLPGVPRVATIQLPSIALQATEVNCISSKHKKAPPKPCFRAPLHTTYFRISAGALPDIDTQGSYNSVPRRGPTGSV